MILPNENLDPAEAHQLLHRYLDEFALCDEVGLDIMVNEHHSTATCMTVSVPMALAVIARETKKARLLTLGNPIANRPDPVRVAEEMAWLDVLSGGRLEMGLVKGAPYEIAPANSNPARLMRRYWEAHDLILKALSTTDGPFNWEGEYFHYRNVNIWPRPIQQPTPPVWMTGMSVDSGRLAAETRPRDRHAAVRRHGEADVRHVSRRPRANMAGRQGRIAWPTPPWWAWAIRATRGCGVPTRSPTMCAPRRWWRSNSPIRQATTRSAANVAMLKAGPRAHRIVKDRQGNMIDHRKASVQQFMDTDTVFAGTPDDVFAQIQDFNARMGGVGHLLFFGQGGYLNHQDAMENITLFGREVAPRLREMN